MFIESFSAFLSRVSQQTYLWRLILLLIAVNLISGCAADTALHAKDTQASYSTNAKNASSNRSYKIKGKTYSPRYTTTGYKASGKASWYGAKSGNHTASSTRFNPKALTAAHKTLPIPSKVRVTNLNNGRYVDVVINDRGPFTDNKLIDLG
jgi:rare lipoprotein A